MDDEFDPGKLYTSTLDIEKELSRLARISKMHMAKAEENRNNALKINLELYREHSLCRQIASRKLDTYVNMSEYHGLNGRMIEVVIQLIKGWMDKCEKMTFNAYKKLPSNIENVQKYKLICRSMKLIKETIYPVDTMIVITDEYCDRENDPIQDIGEDEWFDQDACNSLTT